MAIKKSELYSSLWASCDELRGSMDASKGFIKDGNQNPLREQDIHKIVDTFNHYIETQETKSFIFQHSEFTSFGKQMDAVFNQWASQTTAFTTALDKGLKPKNAIHTISENLLQHYAKLPQMTKPLKLMGWVLQ